MPDYSDQVTPDRQFSNMFSNNDKQHSFQKNFHRYNLIQTAVPRVPNSDGS